MKKTTQLSTPISRSNAIAEYCKKHGIPTSNGTKEMIGKASIVFLNSPSQKRAITEQLFKKHGIPSEDKTKEMQGKTSVKFISSDTNDYSPSDESMDRAVTALRYHNQRKGH